MGKEKRGRQRGEGPFPSFFGVSVVSCESSMTEKRAPVARCLVLHSHGEAPACPRSVASQQDDGPGRRVGGREARGWEKSTGGKGHWAPMCLCRYCLSSWSVCFWLSSEYRVMSSLLSLCAFYISLFGFLVWYTGNFNRGAGRERKGKCLPPAMGGRLWPEKRQGLEA